MIIAFGHNIGNLGRQKKSRVLMSKLVEDINLKLSKADSLFSILDYYRHTGNFIICHHDDVSTAP